MVLFQANGVFQETLVVFCVFRFFFETSSRTPPRFLETHRFLLLVSEEHGVFQNNTLLVVSLCLVNKKKLVVLLLIVQLVVLLTVSC